ncbi:MAG: sulfatase [Planctomycetota bacterium]
MKIKSQHSVMNFAVAFIGLLLGIQATGCAAAEVQKPNVVLIVCDDLNDYITGIPSQTGHPQARTPHVEKLAESGVAFRRAYSNNPVCAPSRSSFLTGIYPHTSGNLFWDKWFYNPVLKNSKTVMEHFRDNGYQVLGSGKLMHHFKKEVWGEFKHLTDYGPFVYDGKDRVAHPSVPQPYGSIGPVDGSYAPLSDVPYADDDDPKTGWIYGGWGKVKPLKYTSEDDRDPTPDERNAAWAAGQIAKFAEQKQDKPFFMAVGFIRPHTPLHVPKKYFDMFPLDSVQAPLIKQGDAEDTHFKEVIDKNSKGLRYFRTLNESYDDPDTAIKNFTRAYLACVAAVDDCIGQVVEAVDNSDLKDNTIIVLTSDHGWQMGQKDFLFKNSPWEESTRIPFIVRAPGVTKAGGVAEHPISLIDLYPTLVDLCGLTGDTRKNENGAKLDGFSVRPFLEDPDRQKWDGPDAALSMVFGGKPTEDATKEETDRLTNQNWTVRTKRWRYIRYNNGTEELYDHENDPREWNNLADDPKFKSQKKKMSKQLESMVPLKK